MPSRHWQPIYIDRDPSDPYKGWGWVDARPEDVKKFKIPTGYPDTYWKSRKSPERHNLPKRGNLPSRGKAGGKTFTVNLDGSLISIKAQKSLTIQAICAWVKTWANQNAKLITPGNRTVSLDGEKLAHQAYFIYFILNEDSNAVKIGYAKNLEKRMKALQTASPAELKLIKLVQVENHERAQDLELSLHKQFDAFRLSGEWFKAEAPLLDYVNECSEQWQGERRDS